MKNKLTFSKFEKTLLTQAKAKNCTIVLTEAEADDRVLQAGLYLAKHRICKPVFLTKSADFMTKYSYISGVTVINYLVDDKKEELANILYKKRKAKGMTLEQAKEQVNDPIYFATLLVESGICDGMVCGAITSTADSLRPALQIIKGKTKDAVISSFFILVCRDKTLGDNGILLLSDCALNQNPTVPELANITKDTVQSARQLGLTTPKVALLSYSTLGSANGDIPSKMQSVKTLLDGAHFVVDGDYQMDSATRGEVASIKAKNGRIKGDANILIFPNLESGNITYKAMCRVGDVKAIGPITQGFRLPVNDLSRGANTQEIILTVALTCLQVETK